MKLHATYRYILLIFCTWYSVYDAAGQSFYTNGTARKTGGTCYQLTSAINNQNGSVWYADKIDLSKDVDLEFTLNLGSKDDGADGIVFVMQTVGTTALGQNGGGIGFEGFSPSLGIEFDTYQNVEVGDPAADHIGILKNGSIRHNGSDAIAGPVQAHSSQTNIEDGKNYPVRIVYKPSVKRLEVWFDCTIRLITTIDLANSIFKGKTDVYWGFTSATGGKNNVQIACLRDDILISDTLSICRGESIKLNARESKNNSYTWTPASSLSNARVKSPVATPMVTTEYQVEARDICDRPFVDTVLVEVSEPFSFDAGKDSLLCNGEIYRIAIPNTFDSLIWNDGFGANVRSLSSSGTYIVTVWRGVCMARDTITIVANRTPVVSIDGELEFCEGESTVLSAIVKPDGQSFQWEDGTDSSPRLINFPGKYTITASNDCGDHTASVEVEEIIVPQPELGADTTICEGTSITKNVPNDLSHEIIWNDGDQNHLKVLSTAGTYWVELRNGECSRSDTVNINLRYAPELNLPGDFLLCRGFRKTLESGVTDGTVTWNGEEVTDFELYNFEGPISVVAQNTCGRDSTLINVKLEECFCDLYVPNAVTPNGDELNESFGPQLNCQYLLDYELIIFNRWGDQLFRSNQIDSRWNLTIDDQRVQGGIYYYILRYTGIVEGYPKKHEIKDYLMVID